MPVMDGYEASLALREVEPQCGAAEVPIVALTANALEGTRALPGRRHERPPGQAVPRLQLVERLRRWSQAQAETGLSTPERVLLHRSRSRRAANPARAGRRAGCGRGAPTALPKPVIQAQRISRRHLGERSSTRHAASSSEARPSRARRAGRRRAWPRCGARPRGQARAHLVNVHAVEDGSGMPRSSLAVATQISWLASIGTSANSSAACAVSCLTGRRARRAGRRRARRRPCRSRRPPSPVGVLAVDQRLNTLPGRALHWLDAPESTQPAVSESIEMKPMPVPEKLGERPREVRLADARGRAATAAISERVAAVFAQRAGGTSSSTSVKLGGSS